jgi:hypothetical protein
MAYITTAQLKSYMGISSSSDDALLSLCIDRAQSVINSYTNRVFESTADTTRYYTPIIDRIGSGLGYSGDLSDDYTITTNYDLISITSITNGTGDAIPTNAVVTLPPNFTPGYAVRIKQASGYFWSYVGSPEASVSITGRWGYSLTAPANIQQACLRIASGFYRQRDGSPDISDSIISADGSQIVSSAMRRDVKQLLDPYRRTS